ncbi:MAG: PQQ-binding-like beta-propeller repeat protein, partial [Planctomycetes bacterium]|nr:PQQ-binding-like beta-propeller repeat protein [Planctomycetota bacterium]
YALTPGGKVKWTFSVGRADIVPQIKLGRDGTLYFGTIRGPSRRAECRFYAVDPRGRGKWSVLLTDSGSLCSPAIAPDGTIYVGGDRLRAVDAQDGSLKWTFDVATPAHAAPAVGRDGTIYLAGPGWDQRKPDAHRLYALNPDGTEKWSLRVGWCESTPAVADDGTIYVTGWNIDAPVAGPPTGLHAVSPEGRLKWSYRTYFPDWHFHGRQRGLPWGSDCSPIVGADGTVYFGADTGVVYAVNADGTLKWRLDVGGEFDIRPAIDAQGTLYICHAGGPGAFEDFAMRCYAISDRGTRVMQRPRVAKRVEALRRRLHEARRAGDLAEAEEIRQAIKNLLADATEQEGGRIKQRIRTLRRQLGKARAAGNHQEVREIVELLRELQAGRGAADTEERD